MYAFGAVLGMFGLPALADAKGRRFSMNLAFSLQFIAMFFLIFGIYQNISSLIMVGQVLNGIFSSGIMLLTYIVTG